MKVTFYKRGSPGEILWRGNIQDSFIPRVGEYVAFNSEEASGIVHQVSWGIHDDSVDILVRYT